MTKRLVVSRKMFKKRRALKYPANIVILKTGAPGTVTATNQERTKDGVIFISETTGGAYLVHTGTASLLDTTG